MESKKIVSTVARIIGLSVINFIIWFLASSILTNALRIPVHPEIQNTMVTAMALMLATSFLNTAVLSYAVVRSGFRRWKLVVTIFLVYFGIHTLLSQIETIYFNASLNIPTREIVSFFLIGFITAVVFSPLAVIILGRFKKTEGFVHVPHTLAKSKADLLARIAIIAIFIYPVLYFIFGYFVLWQFSEARVFYSGTPQKLPFFSHMASLMQNDPWLYPWQVLRGFIWVGIAIPVIRMSRAKWWETAVLVGLLFAILMNAVHIIPNPYMPGIVSKAHLLETATSNFILGFLTTLLLSRSQRR
jgi:hypothetical protein